MRRHFHWVRSRGVTVHGRHLIALAARGSPRGPLLGVTASKKVGNAVWRNRAKRLIREAFRHRREELPAWLHLVVIARRSLAEVGLAEARLDLDRVLTRALEQLKQRRSHKRGFAGRT